MKRTFELNGVTIIARKFSYSLEADLEEGFGLKLEDLKKRTTAFIRAYVAICLETDKEEVNELIEAHIDNGGTLEDVAKVIVEELKDFFQRQNEKQKAKKKTE